MALEGSGRLWRALEGSGVLWRTVEDSGVLLRALEGSEGLLEGSGGLCPGGLWGRGGEGLWRALNGLSGL